MGVVNGNVSLSNARFRKEWFWGQFKRALYNIIYTEHLIKLMCIEKNNLIIEKIYVP